VEGGKTMVRYLERVGVAVKPRLADGELALAAVPVVLSSVPPAAGASARGPVFSAPGRIETMTAPVVRPVAPRFAERMVLVLTDRRVMVFEQRRFRSLPAAHLSDLLVDQIANVEGVHGSSRGAARLDLVLVLTDGSATTLTVPRGFEEAATMLIRRLQGRMRA
jgi:hypothetical protein